MSDVMDLLTPIIEHDSFFADFPGLIAQIAALSDAMEEAGRVHGPAWLRTIWRWGSSKRRSTGVASIYCWEPFPPISKDSKPKIGQGWESALLWDLRKRLMARCGLCSGSTRGSSPFWCPVCRKRGWVLAPDEQSKSQPRSTPKPLAEIEKEDFECCEEGRT